VVYGPRIVMAPGLGEALGKLVVRRAEGEAPAEVGPERLAPMATAAVRALEEYRAAVRSQQAGDWAQFGVHLQALGELLEEMAEESAP